MFGFCGWKFFSNTIFLHSAGAELDLQVKICSSKEWGRKKQDWAYGQNDQPFLMTWCSWSSWLLFTWFYHSFINLMFWVLRFVRGRTINGVLWKCVWILNAWLVAVVVGQRLFPGQVAHQCVKYLTHFNWWFLFLPSNKRGGLNI